MTYADLRVSHEVLIEIFSEINDVLINVPNFLFFSFHSDPEETQASNRAFIDTILRF